MIAYIFMTYAILHNMVRMMFEKVLELSFELCGDIQMMRGLILI
jgi:hypothetical protein